MKKYKRIWVFFIFIFYLSACAVGPNYVCPSVSVPARYKEAKSTGHDWQRAKPQDLSHRGDWWFVFHDKKLNELENQLNASNQSIKTAYYNYQQAKALVDEARAAYFPILSASLDYTKQKTSRNTFTSNNLTSIPSTNTSGTIRHGYTWLVNASWVPDIWGSVRRSVEASEASAEASAALLAGTKLSAQGSLAQYYFELRGLDADQKLLNQTVKNYQHILQYTKNRLKLGVDSQLDIIAAKSQLESAQAAAINNKVLRAQYEHAIAVLIGIPPANLSLSPHPLTAVPPPVPVQVPSLLLERRPDIAQAERLAAQANAEIGVAEAAFFPALTLSGSASTVTNKLFAVPNLNWTLGAQLAETILDGGLRSASVRAAKANYLASAASYRQTVLAAFQNVEDNLAAQRILTQQSFYQNKAAEDARKTLTLTVNQYRSGTVDYSSVLTAQINAFTAEKAAVDLKYLRMTTTVNLILALGGGWSYYFYQPNSIDYYYNEDNKVVSY